eukprot:TRINITY_DN1202_c0_g2_i2.p1 TRINITY_DN1202_c0_g2~~TRINITY_DN1202_c0_g2_i2.p1  ORF type:complete len:182 (-),score=31.50 TRINITY_DN1202_c0_g2_i2:489-1034(-)
MHTLLKKIIHKNIWRAFAETFKAIAPKYREQAEELAGIAQLTNISITDVYVTNCFNEINAMCTTIVARDKNNKLVLARNFDFAAMPEARKVCISVVYKRQGKEIARCGAIAGYVGVFTCVRLGAFAVAMNGWGLGDIQEVILRLRKGIMPASWMLRETVLNVGNYMRRLTDNSSRKKQTEF